MIKPKEAQQGQGNPLGTIAANKADVVPQPVNLIVTLLSSSSSLKAGQNAEYARSTQGNASNDLKLVTQANKQRSLRKL